VAPKPVSRSVLTGLGVVARQRSVSAIGQLDFGDRFRGSGLRLQNPVSLQPEAFDVILPPSKQVTTDRRSTDSNANSVGVHSIGIRALLNLKKLLWHNIFLRFPAPIHRCCLRNTG
jgi:hypothetical protein